MNLFIQYAKLPLISAECLEFLKNFHGVNLIEDLKMSFINFEIYYKHHYKELLISRQRIISYLAQIPSRIFISHIILAYALFFNRVYPLTLTFNNPLLKNVYYLVGICQVQKVLRTITNILF